MKTDPKVAVVVVNYNGLEDTLHCLESLRQMDYPNYRVVVVDNGSAPSDEQEISAAHNWAEVIRSEQNLGWAGGNNRGIRWSLQEGADYVLLLNNDTRVHSRILRQLVDAAHAAPDL